MPPAALPACDGPSLRLVAEAYSSPLVKPNEKSEAFKAAVNECSERLKAFQPLPLASLPAQVQQALAWMRLKADEAIATDPAKGEAFLKGVMPGLDQPNKMKGYLTSSCLVYAVLA